MPEDRFIDTPESPPRAPIIPVGLATKLGVYSTAVLGIAALVAAVLDGDHSTETVTALAGAVATLISTVLGRMAQAYAIYRDAPTPLRGAADALDVMRAPLPEGDDSLLTGNDPAAPSGPPL